MSMANAPDDIIYSSKYRIIMSKSEDRFKQTEKNVLDALHKLMKK